MALHSLETEKAVLSCILQDYTALYEIKPWVTEADVFYHDINKEVWKTLLKMDERGDKIDVLTLNSSFPSNKRNDDTSYYLTGLVDEVPSVANAGEYAKRLHEYWLRRKLLTQTHRFKKLTEDSGQGIDVILEEAHSTIGDLLHLRPSSRFDMSTLLEETLDSIYEKRNLTNTGYGSIDSIISGMTKGEITIIAGRPGNCKTSMAVNIARNLILSGKKVVMMNREMPNVEMMKKIVAMEARTISYRNLRHGIIDDRRAIDRAMDIIDEKYKNLYMFDDIRDLPSTFRELKRIKPDVVIDDHIGLIEYPATDRRDLRLKIGETSRKYKWLAKSEKMNVVMVSQLNRNIEYRNDRVPRLSDLAESGNLEQDAEIVMFTHYPWVSQYEDSESGKYGLDVIVAKNRYGSTGIAKMGYAGDSCLVMETSDEAKNHDQKNIKERQELSDRLF